MERSTDGGKTFVRVGAPSFRFNPRAHGGTRGIGSFQFANATDGYVGVLDFNAGGAGSESLYRTRNGGDSWQRFALGGRVIPIVTTRGRVYALVATCPATVFDCTSYLLASASVTSSIWRQTSFTIPKGQSNPVITAFGSKVWLVMTPSGGSQVRLLVSGDAGHHFSNLPTTGWGGIVCRATATSSLTLWGFCSTGMMGYGVRSTDGGRHFAAVAWRGALNSAEIVPVSDDVALYVLNESGILVTTDGGRHFRPSLSFKVPATFAVAIASTTIWLTMVFLPKNVQLRLTTDAGRSWTEVPLPTL